MTHLRRNDLLHGQQPRAPLRIRHADLPHILDLDPDQWELWRQANPNLHVLLVDDKDRLDLVGSRSDLDRKVLVVAQRLSSRIVRITKMGELVGDKDGRKVARGKGRDGH